jgi:ArsR family transcriptional regulator, arsenate/arsenite/antimonite-responsive transcriptional repressor
MKLARLVKISKALADQTRLMILRGISARRGMICGDIVTMRGVTPATVSHHLKILADAGLIESSRHGQFVCSRAVPEAIQEYLHALSQVTGARKRSEGLAEKGLAKNSQIGSLPRKPRKGNRRPIRRWPTPSQADP